MAAVEVGDFEVVRELLAREAYVDGENFKGVTTGRTDIVKYSLDQGTDINLVAYSGVRPLEWALWIGRDDIAKMLEEAIAKAATDGRLPFLPALIMFIDSFMHITTD